MGKERAQSAMEYLMTYGWAILIIALVAAVLFGLGLFNNDFFQTRASAGSCQVYRPDGPGTITQIALIGTCNNALPKFTMISKGIGDYFIVNNSNSIASLTDIKGNEITITAWIYVFGSPYHDIVDKESQYGMKLDYNNIPKSNANCPGGMCLEWDTANDWNGVSFPIPNGGFKRWMFIAVTKDGNEKYWYGNGQLIGNEISPGGISYVSSNLTIGAISPGYTGFGSAEWFNGSISNVQIYNTALPLSSIEQLYMEGIGGDPQRLQNLVAWWPLNGNPVDYSGDNLNSYIENDIYSGTTWFNNYST
jgi:hypothetical protein